MKKVLLSIFIVLLGVFLCPTFLSSSSDEAVLVVEVFIDGNPVEGAAVSIQIEADGFAETREGTTDASGSVSFDFNIGSPSRAHVTVEYSNGQQQTDSILLEPECTKTLRFNGTDSDES